jgi:hypothetical protein
VTRRVALLAALGACACDQGEPALDELEGVGPPLHVIGVQPEQGLGTDCPDDDDTCGAPEDGDIVLHFDRYLDPTTTVRQAIRVYTGSPDNSVFLEPVYDMLERAVVYPAPESEYELGALYTIELVLPTEDPASDGFRAFDGAPLEEGELGLKFNFRVRNADRGPQPPRKPVTCKEVRQSILKSSCGFGGCHGGLAHVSCPAGQMRNDRDECVAVNPREGLELDSNAGIVLTAIGQPAHQTETTAKGGDPLVNPSRVGVAMPIVDPGIPGNSYLMYKLIVNRSNYVSSKAKGPCQTAYRDVVPPIECGPPDAEEVERLRNWFVRMEPMPYQRSLDYDAMVKLQSWIQDGAGCDTTPVAVDQAE